MSKNSTS